MLTSKPLRRRKPVTQAFRPFRFRQSQDSSRVDAEPAIDAGGTLTTRAPGTAFTRTLDPSSRPLRSKRTNPLTSSRTPPRSAFLGLPAIGLVAFLLLPLAALLAHLSGSQLTSVLTNSATQSAVATSLISTTVATTLVCVLGIPLAYVLARYRFPGRALIGGLVYVPLVLPPIVGGILLLLVWGGTGMVGQFLEPKGIAFVGEISGIVLAQMFVSAPFVVVAARSAFERVDGDLDEAARIAGADALQVFWSIALPLGMRAILAGAALSWMRAFGEFGATVIMAYHPYSFPVYTWVQFSSAGLAPVLPLSLLAIILGAAALLVAAFLERVRVFPALAASLFSSKG